MKTNLYKRFQDLLLSFSQAEKLDMRHGKEHEFWQEFGGEHAVFVLGMSGIHNIVSTRRIKTFQHHLSNQNRQN